MASLINTLNARDVERINRKIARLESAEKREKLEARANLTLEERALAKRNDTTADERTQEELSIVANAHASVRSLKYNSDWDKGFSVIATTRKREHDYQIMIEVYIQGKVHERETLYLATKARLNANGSISMTEPTVSLYAPNNVKFTLSGLTYANEALREHIKLELRGKLEKFARKHGSVPMYRCNNNAHFQGTRVMADTASEPKEIIIDTDESDDSDEFGIDMAE